jgi:polyisoprenoid-binding protein YceI
VTTTTTTTTTDGPIPVETGVEGRWVATSDSEVGYRVTEVLFGVNTEGVGRTNEVEGELVIDGTTITAVEFTVDLDSVTSDDGRRDGQFRGRIMNVNQFPTATFALTEPIDLAEIPAPGEQITATATGDLTLRGATNEVVFDVVAQRSEGRIGVLGTIGVVFADYQIPNPSIAGITTEDNGLLEFVLVFTRP